MTHYKLPLDEVVDKDIIDWINKFQRTKKGEMVRHAIRYYIASLGEGEIVKFPDKASHVQQVVEPPKVTQTLQEKNVKERKRPSLNLSNLK